MKSLSLSIASLALIFLFGVARAVKVDGPREAEENASHIVIGTVTAIYSKTTRDSSYEWTRCAASIRVEGVEKGTDLKVGDLIYARYISATKWVGKGALPPGPGGHIHPPAEGDRRKICLTKGEDGGFDVYYVSGWKAVDGKTR